MAFKLDKIAHLFTDDPAKMAYTTQDNVFLLKEFTFWASPRWETSASHCKNSSYTVKNGLPR
jgi:hypothetical protein